ncbi:hypothetical protein DyAD56_15950 [Dyella sp. AD56]|uniref:hypothetical protein n=1 Tax=Dyella sp. AD56 TaxID=1528744 RepID=UPI000C839E12|nr:hypothetical protein [Dyella sp. AD56]PMQ04181.1 hypothetical protein DyAD56_15950 [Dyella sp. AD56]
MTHPAYLLARLHPKNVRFDIGSGGLPELTSSDIAGALGMVPRGLGRDLLCLYWWPDSRWSLQHHALNAMNAELMAEYRRRENAMLDATLAIAISSDRFALRRAQGMYASAHENRWPSVDEVQNEIRLPNPAYARLAPAVLAEILSPRQCPDCEGRKEVASRTGPKPCGRCQEQGVIPSKNVDRAGALGIKEDAYRKTWHYVYTWLMDHCADGLAAASRALERAAA